jgi:hypothetical protein
MKETIEFIRGLRVAVRRQEYSREDWFVGTVERLTKTQVILEDGKRFKIEYPYEEHGSKDRWATISYDLWALDDEAKEKIFRRKAIAKLSKTKWEEACSEKLRKILVVLGEKQ